MSRQELVIICGSAGVGKTTLGKRMACQLRACLLDIDTVSEKLVQVGLQSSGHDPSDRDSPLYKLTYRESIHETLFAIARENLDFVPCVLVAPFTKELQDPHFLERVRSLVHAPVRIILVTCPEAERKTRIEARGNPRDNSKLVNWEKYSAANSLLDAPLFEHQLVNTSAKKV